jgi:hypothetical protein
LTQLLISLLTLTAISKIRDIEIGPINRQHRNEGCLP